MSQNEFKRQGFRKLIGIVAEFAKRIGGGCQRRRALQGKPLYDRARELGISHKGPRGVAPEYEMQRRVFAMERASDGARLSRLEVVIAVASIVATLAPLVAAALN